MSTRSNVWGIDTAESKVQLLIDDADSSLNRKKIQEAIAWGAAVVAPLQQQQQQPSANPQQSPDDEAAAMITAEEVEREELIELSLVDESSSSFSQEQTIPINNSSAVSFSQNATVLRYYEPEQQQQLQNDDSKKPLTNNIDRNTCTGGNSGSGEDNKTVAQLTVESMSRAFEYAIAHWKVLFFGQGLSIMASFGSFSQATLHFECGLNAPAFSATIMYSLLSCLLLPALWFRRRREACNEELQRAPLKPRYTVMGVIPIYAPLRQYFFAAFLHLEANYLIVWSFRYTTLTSVMLLDAIALPSAMALSRIFLRRRYVDIHIMGAIICVFGTTFNVLGDWHTMKQQGNARDEHFPNKLLGDTLAIAGSVIYGANNVINEKFSRYGGGPLEYLACLGFCGTFMASIQTLIFDRQHVSNLLSGDQTCSTSMGLSLVITFAFTKSLLYCGSSLFLVHSEAALLNISLLTSDLWSVGFAWAFEGLMPSPFFLAALSLIFGGVCIYEIAPSPIVDDIDAGIRRLRSATRELV